MRRPRFSLRAAVLAFTLVGLGLGLYGRHLVERRRQIRLVEVARIECEKAGCLWGTYAADPNFQVFGINGSLITPDIARSIIEAQAIKRIIMRKEPAKPAQHELARAFHRLMPETNCWERNDWVPKVIVYDQQKEVILNQRNGVTP